MLVGTKLDLREDAEADARASSEKNAQRPISYEQTARTLAAGDLGSFKFLECSGAHAEGPQAGVRRGDPRRPQSAGETTPPFVRSARSFILTRVSRADAKVEEEERWRVPAPLKSHQHQCSMKSPTNLFVTSCCGAVHNRSTLKTQEQAELS
jgi:hypothetical protein